MSIPNPKQRPRRLGICIAGKFGEAQIFVFHDRMLTCENLNTQKCVP